MHAAEAATPPSGPRFLPTGRARLEVPSLGREKRRHRSQEPRRQVRAAGAPVGRTVRRPPGSALRLQLRGAIRGRSLGPGQAGRTPMGPRLGSAPRRRPPEAVAREPEAGAAGRPPPRARSAPASRDQEPRGLGSDRRVSEGPWRSSRADDPLPPAERRPAVTDGSLTRAMVAVAILRPSRPPRAPHAPAPSAVSRDLGAGGSARRRTKVSR